MSIWLVLAGVGLSSLMESEQIMLDSLIFSRERLEMLAIESTSPIALLFVLESCPYCEDMQSLFLKIRAAHSVLPT